MGVVCLASTNDDELGAVLSLCACLFRGTLVVSSTQLVCVQVSRGMLHIVYIY